MKHTRGQNKPFQNASLLYVAEALRLDISNFKNSK